MRPVEEDERPDRRWSWLDLRLWPAATAVWGVSLLAPRLSAGALAAVACGAALLGAAMLRAHRPGARIASTALAALVVAAGAGAVRAAERESSPLTDIAADHGAADVLLTVGGPPHPVRGAGEPRVVLDGMAALAGAAAGPVLVFAPAEGWADLVPGQELRIRATAAPPRPGDDVVAVLSVRGPPGDVGAAPVTQRVAATIRSSLAAGSARTLDDRPGGLLPGLVVGDTSAMDPVLDEEFRRAGLSHLTAVSGANVAVVVAGALWPLRRRAVDRRIQAATGAAAVIGFVVLAGPSASVLRAAAMGAVTLLALASGRSRAALPALAAAATLLLLADPSLSRDPGFALSVVATAAIVLLAPRWSRLLRRRGWPSLPADAVAVSAAAGLATAPLVAGLSGTVSLVTLPANLLVAPAVAPATVLGLLAAVAGVVLPPVGDALVWLAGWPVRWIVLVAERSSELPDAVAGWPGGLPGAMGLAVLLGAGAWVLVRFAASRPPALAALAGLVLVGWPLRQPLDGWPPDRPVVIACDVGQGDALVLPVGGGAGVLVDAGPEVGPVDACLDRLDIDELPLVLLSHLDADHVGGLAGALSGRDVGVVATGALSPADERAGPLAELVRSAGGTREVLTPGDLRTAGDAVLEVLAPSPRWATAAAEPNDLSLVVRVTVRGVRVLLTGDLGAEAEARLVRDGTDLRADVLKVPHHGSADVDPGFLAATGARVALVSVGADNTYGHPAPRLLDLLTGLGVQVHRTDREGDLAVVGEAGDWGVAAHGLPFGTAAHALDPAVPTGAGGWAPGGRDGRHPVTPCRGASLTGRAHLPAARRHRRGGAAAVPRGERRPFRGPRPPPRRRGARAGRAGSAGRPAGRRAGALAVRRAPAGRRHRCPRGGERAGRLADLLRQGARPRPDAGDRARRRQAERGTGQGVQGRRGGGRRVPQGQLGRRPDRLRAQRGPHLRRPDHPRCRDRARRCHRRRPAGAVGRGQPAGERLRREHRRRRRRALPPRTGRGHRLHRRRAGAHRRSGRLDRDAPLGAGAGRGTRAHRRRDRRRSAHRCPGRLAELQQSR
ncbi:ComEC/Rec2 family competence protein [Blastococcus sp. TF02-8]|nr:ComEC/Rec2 family competence protein [Blastococcus sp. TF02-8]